LPLENITNMKKLFFITWIVITSLSFYCCKKNNTKTTSTSQWNLGGTTYQGSVTTYDTSTGYTDLNSIDKASNSIGIIFYTHAAVSGTFNVINNSTLTNDNDCILTAGNNTTEYTSSEVGTSTVTLTNSGGKITATFSNVTLAKGSTTLIISGTLISTN
jgi:hypothetical protein